MVAEGNGWIRFELWTHGWREYYIRKPTGGTVFLASNLVQVGIHTCVDFTLYEEVFYTQGGTPPYDFLFTQSWVTISGTPSLWSSWCTFCTLSPPVPPGVFVTWNTYDVFIDNPDR